VRAGRPGPLRLSCPPAAGRRAPPPRTGRGRGRRGARRRPGGLRSRLPGLRGRWTGLRRVRRLPRHELPGIDGGTGGRRVGGSRTGLRRLRRLTIRRRWRAARVDGDRGACGGSGGAQAAVVGREERSYAGLTRAEDGVLSPALGPLRINQDARTARRLPTRLSMDEVLRDALDLRASSLDSGSRRASAGLFPALDMSDGGARRPRHARTRTSAWTSPRPGVLVLRR
jgi:hypothetical protein